MKFKAIILTFLAIAASPVFSQSGTVVERAFACSLINGYSIEDAASVMREFEWDEDFAPGFVLLREAAYASDEFRENWDFVVSLYYPSMEDLVEKRLAFRARTGGSEGYSLRDVARCDNSVRLNSVDFVPGPSAGGDVPDTSAIVSISCERNGAPMSAAMAAAQNIAGIMGPNLRNLQVINRQFGGPSQGIASRVGYRMVFNSPENFATAMDALRSNQPEQAPACNVPSAWLGHAIYQRDN